MIAVVGVPAWLGAAPHGPAGRACDIARIAAGRGVRVELVGRAGDDADGDALVLALGALGVGHAALLRDPSRPTPVIDARVAEDEGHLVTGPPEHPAPGGGAVLLPDVEDLALGLSYLGSIAVVVVSDELGEPAMRAAADAASFAGAHLVVLLAPGRPAPSALPEPATVLAVPAGPDDGEFAALVGAYAAALDGGAAPGDAFTLATGGAGWEAVDPSG